MIAGAEPILRIEGLSKSFPGVRALDDVDFTLHAGEVHCLVGENGAGKSTFIKILSGAVTPDAGRITLFGSEGAFPTPDRALAMGIQTVYQENVLVPTLTVAENIYLGHEPVHGRLARVLGIVRHSAASTGAQELIAALGLRLDPRAIVSGLSSAERQLVGILRALSRDIRILVLDEPTAALSATESRTLLALIRNIVTRGVGVIYISHHLEEVFDVADRITVLKDGRRVGLHDRDETEPSLLIREMVGRDASQFYQRDRGPRSGQVPPLLQVRSYAREGVIHDVTFDVQAGEIFGLGGMIGAGRTELVRLLFGLDRRSSGALLLNGKEITPASPLDAVRRGVCLITEDRQHSGLILVRSVSENISLARINLQTSPWLNLEDEQSHVDRMVSQLRIAISSTDQPVGTLSGGNQQKVVLARWLLTQAQVFLFDEPTRGIDIGAKQEIYQLMANLSRNGAAIVMVSSDMPELIAMSDRVGIMRDGHLVAILDQGSITEERVLAHSIGSEAS